MRPRAHGLGPSGWSSATPHPHKSPPICNPAPAPTRPPQTSGLLLAVRRACRLCGLGFLCWPGYRSSRVVQRRGDGAQRRPLTHRPQPAERSTRFKNQPQPLTESKTGRAVSVTILSGHVGRRQMLSLGSNSGTSTAEPTDLTSQQKLIAWPCRPILRSQRRGTISELFSCKRPSGHSRPSSFTQIRTIRLRATVTKSNAY